VSYAGRITANYHGKNFISHISRIIADACRQLFNGSKNLRIHGEEWVDSKHVRNVRADGGEMWSQCGEGDIKPVGEEKAVGEVKTIGEEKTGGDSIGQRYREIMVRLDRVLSNRSYLLQEDFSLEFLAREIGTNRTYLSRAIKYCSGDNFSGYVNSIKIAYAKELISQKLYDKRLGRSGFDFDLEDVAVASGFGTKRNFVRIFKEREGVTPMQYVKRMQLFVTKE